MAAGARVHRFIVERRAKHLGLRGAPNVGPHVYGRDRVPARIEAEKPMPECRHADRAGIFGRPVWMNRIQACDHRLQQSIRVVLDAAVPGESGGVLHLVGAAGDGPSIAVVKRGPRGGGPDVERNDH